MQRNFSRAAVRNSAFSTASRPLLSPLTPDKPKLDYEDIVHYRKKYMSESLETFTAYDKPLVLDKGDMQYMWDIQGNKYIDLLGQNLCISVGHRHPKVMKAAIDQMNKLPHCTTMYYNDAPAQLAKQLVERMPLHPSGEDWVVHFVCTGSEAVDLAVQMARVYTGNTQMLGLYKAYHGLHGYAAGLTAIGKKAQQKGAGNTLTGISRVRPNDIEELESQFNYGLSEDVAGFIAEPLQGYGGIIPLSPGYLKEAFDLTRKNGGVAIADEVQTGFGRCGDAYWGFDTPNNKAMPDIVTIAKGIGNGIGVLGAVIARRSIGHAFASRMMFNTMGSNPMSCAAGSAVLNVIDDEKLVENCKARGDQFTTRLTELCVKHPAVLEECRGSGLFQGLQIKGKNKDASTVHAHEMHRRLLKLGIVVGRGSAAGNVFRVQPPMCINEADVNEVCDKIDLVAGKYVKEMQL